MNPLANDYTQQVRPWLGQLLGTLKLDTVYERADGNFLYRSDQQGILDLVGGYGANLFGHYHPKLVECFHDLLRQQVPFNAQGTIRSRPGQLAKILSDKLQASTGQEYIATFTNTGTEAVEAAVKHALFAKHQAKTHFLDSFKKTVAQLKQQKPVLPAEILDGLQKLGYQGNSELEPILDFALAYNQRVLNSKPVFLALKNSFHGKTNAALSLTHNPLFRTGSQSPNFEVYFLNAEIPELKAQIKAAQHILLDFDLRSGQFQMRPWNQIAGCLVEPLQGEGGIQAISPEFLQACQQAGQRQGFPLILDEIQSGMGRTGSFVYSEQIQLQGDYYLLSKSLGGGLSKIGVCLIRADQYQSLFGKIHSSTFAEDELSAGLGIKALEVLDEENLMQRAAETGLWLKQELNQLAAQYPQVIREVRGVGLMLGIDFAPQTESASPAIQMLSRQDLLGYMMTGFLYHEHQIRVAPTLSSPLTLRLEPAATISQAELTPFLKAMEQLCQILSHADIYALTRFLVEDKSELSLDFRCPATDYEVSQSELPQVAFVGHFIQAKDMPLWDPGFARFSEDQLQAYLDAVYLWLDPEIYDRRIVRTATGQAVQLNFIGLCASSLQMHQHLRGDLEPIQAKLEKALAIAQAAGCQALGLGGYNSIVTGNALALPPDKMALTTGNALTVGMGLRAIHQTAAEQGIELSSSTFAAVGATGNIASVYADLMASEVPRIILIGRPEGQTRLAELAERIYSHAIIALKNNKPEDAPLMGVPAALAQLVNEEVFQVNAPIETILQRLLSLGSAAPIQVGTDLSLLKEAQLILAASNAPEALIYPNLLGTGPVVICDISVPLDTHSSVLEQCPNVRLIQGGVVRLPLNPDFKVGGIPLEKGLSFACMAETLLMGLEGIGKHYSYGRIHRWQVEEILSIADRHGFQLGRARLENSY